MIALDVASDPIVRHDLVLAGAARVAAISYAIDAWWDSASRRRTRARTCPEQSRDAMPVGAVRS